MGYGGSGDVSIPFRAVTGFERIGIGVMAGLIAMFQSLSGLSLGLNASGRASLLSAVVSIPFRAVTGFEPSKYIELALRRHRVSIPFRAVTGFERVVEYPGSRGAFGFNPFQGCHWV